MIEPYTYRIKPSQEKNPVWKTVNLKRKVEHLQIADFIQKENFFAILFVSMKFHYKFPLYLDGLISEFVKSEDYLNNRNRVLILLQDSNDPSDCLHDITMKCLKANIKLMMAFSFEDVGKCLKAFKGKL